MQCSIEIERVTRGLHLNLKRTQKKPELSGPGFLFFRISCLLVRIACAAHSHNVAVEHVQIVIAHKFQLVDNTLNR